MPKAGRPLEHVQVDFCIPKNGLCILHIRDVFSGLSSAVICKRSSEEIMQGLMRAWFTRYGVPERLTWDSERGFVSDEVTGFLEALGIKTEL